MAPSGPLSLNSTQLSCSYVEVRQTQTRPADNLASPELQYKGSCQSQGEFKRAGVLLCCGQAHLLLSPTGPEWEMPGRGGLPGPGRVLGGKGWVTVSTLPLLLLDESRLTTWPLFWAVAE